MFHYGPVFAGTKLTNPILCEMEKRKNAKTLGVTRFQKPAVQGGERGFDALTQFFEKVISVNRNGGEGRFPKQVAGRGGSASQR